MPSDHSTSRQAIVRHTVLVLAKEMAIPDYQSLMLPVLSFAAKGETRVPLAADAIADDLGLSEDEREELLPSGKQRLLHNRIH